VAVTRNQPIKDAPRESRVRLGEQLFRRRGELGFGDSRPRFHDATGVNKRYADDLENARRSNFDEPWLRMAARGYGVTYESLIGVAWGEADALAPVPAAPSPDEDTPPMPPERAATTQPWFDEINERRIALAAQGVTNPAGAQMFGAGTADARAWDDHGYWPVATRVWFIAEVRRQVAGRLPNSGTGTAGA
jgi:hypothetical protein